MAQPTPIPHLDHEEEQDQPTWEKSLSWLAPVSAGILVLSIGFLWYQNKDTGLRTEVALAYATAQTAEDLEAVAQAYSDQPEAPLALLQAASMQFNDQNFEEAQVVYMSFLELYPKHPLRENAEWGVWMGQEQLGELEAALEGFQSVEEDQLLYPQALLGQARIQEKKDNPDAALEIYAQLQDDFPQTPWAEQARVFGEQVELKLRK